MGHTFRYIVKKLLFIIPVCICISLFAFLLGVASPGDPAYFILVADGLVEPTEQEIAETREVLGLNEPLYTQYGRWLFSVIKADFGRSFYDGRPIGKEILNRLSRTVVLAVTALGIASCIGLTGGYLSVCFAYTLTDKLGRVFSLLLISIPGFWLAIVAISLFSEKLGWLPTSGLGSFRHYILPSLVASAGTSGSAIRIFRASLLDELHKPYITTAESKGLPSSGIILNHGFRNALMPVVTVLGTYWGHILGGTVIVETIFAIPGIGQYAVQGILNRDYPVVQAYVLLTGFIFVLVNLLIDLIYLYLNPKLRLGESPE